MNNIVELTFEQIDGNAYNVKFTGTSPAEIFPASVPTFAPHYYQQYQAAYDKYHEYQRTRLGLKSKQVKNKEELDRLRKDVQKSAKDLLDNFNRWGDASEFARIARAISARSDNLQVKISTNCLHLRKLPFHQWQLFPDNTEVIFSGIEARELDRTRTRHPDKIRILVILGNKTGIDIDVDKRASDRGVL